MPNGNSFGTTKSEMYDAFFQALTDIGLGGAPAPTDPIFLAPDALAVGVNTSYTIPNGWNAKVRLNCYNGGFVQINGATILNSANTSWTAIRQNANLYVTPSTPNLSNNFGLTYQRGMLLSSGQQVITPLTGNSSLREGNMSYNNGGSPNVASSFSSNFNLSGVFSNSTGTSRGQNSQTMNLLSGNVISGGGSYGYVVELYLI